MHVIVAIHEHRHGKDIRVFTEPSSVEAWRCALADEWWDREMGDLKKPEDAAAAANLYWEQLGNRGDEFFTTELALLEK